MSNVSPAPLAFEVVPQTGRSTSPSAGASSIQMDSRGRALVEQASHLGLHITSASVSDLYWLDGIPQSEAERLMREGVVDPLTERLHPEHLGHRDNRSSRESADPVHTLDVALLPGVTDTKAETLITAAAILGVDTAGLRVATGRRYRIVGSRAACETLANELLSNPIIERTAIDAELVPAFVSGPSTQPPAPEVVAIRDLDDRALLALSAARRLALDLDEMRSIAAHYIDLSRDPTDLELEMFAQTWSEHCVHKTFRALITSTETDAEGAVTTHEVDGLLKSYLRAATDLIAAPWVRSAFVDNAGIIALDDDFDVAIKVETHNHPSALEPFGGANTGMGGVIRDVIGVSARPFANLDVLCFADSDTPHDAVPKNVLHPRRIRDGVVHGIEDYGNKMGIPTVTGAVLYDAGYMRNPLVFCGTVGVLPHGSHPREVKAGDFVVVLGGRTGRDGLRGATFSSLAMDGGTATVSGGAVQIGHPIAEKQVMEVVLAARDAGLYNAITDCGAGGLSSAIGEMGEDLGALIELADVPLKYAGLSAWEIWLSEAQERMVLAVPSGKWPAFSAIATAHGCPATTIGHFGHRAAVRPGSPLEPALEILHRGECVGLLSVDFLKNGIPRRTLSGEWKALPLPSTADEESLLEGLVKRLADPNLEARSTIMRRYDHEVGGGTVVKPLLGPKGRSPSDGAVITPIELRRKWLDDQDNSKQLPGVALAVGLDPQLGQLDPYVMAWCSVDEAIRNVVAMGGDPDHCAILDNFSWGDPKKPDRLGALVRCTRGCRDAAIHYGTPFVSGKDSLNNEWTDDDGVRHAIPPTLVITALARVPDVSDPKQVGTPALVAAGDVLYMTGVLNDHPLAMPEAAALHRYRILHRAFRDGLIRSCHDVSRGGLALALAEMVMASDGVGIDATLGQIPGASQLRPDRRAFCENPGRHVIAIHPDNVSIFESMFDGRLLTRIGSVTNTADTLVVDGTPLPLAP
jgi:phosphoribosylformylglycinamidine synthase